MAQFTKKAIMLSFLKLLNERPLDKITVKDIVEDCGVSRNSFYYHYRDIFALLDDVFRLETQKAINDSHPEANWQDQVIRSLQFAMVNKRMLYNVFHSVSREKVENYLYSVSDKVMIDFVEKESEGLFCSEEDKLLVARFYKYALVGLFLEWVNSGMKEAPQHYIDRIGLMFGGNIRAALVKSDPRNLGK